MFDKNKWNKEIEISPKNWPRWKCSKCEDGRFVVKDIYRYLQPKLTIFTWSLSDNTAPDHIAIELYCDNDGCDCNSLVVGTKKYISDESKQSGYKYVFCPMYFTVPPLIISLPKHIDFPVESSLLIIQSAKIFYDDPDGAVNKLRMSLEYIFPESYKGEELDKRIKDKLQGNYNLQKMFLACKIFGNKGSHGIKLDHNDILCAYAVLEKALMWFFKADNKDEIKISKKIVGRGEIPSEFNI